ncbi:retrotransposon protein, putative, ty1-copia subclass [Tanacetum coccineum]
MVKMVPYEAFACRCGAEDVVLQESYKPNTHGKLYYACPRSKPYENTFGCKKILWKEERVRLLVGSPGASTTPIYSPGSSWTPIYSPGSSTPPRYSPGASTPQTYSPRTSRNAQCSNCKHLLDKITENHKDSLKLSLEDIKLATQDFSEDNIIGHEGFGNVYKGATHAPGHNIIAAKRLDRKSAEGEAEFMNELEIFIEYKHENVIGLVGYCAEEDEKIIVYDYASKGSLDKYLSDR